MGWGGVVEGLRVEGELSVRDEGRVEGMKGQIGAGREREGGGGKAAESSKAVTRETDYMESGPADSRKGKKV